MIKCFAPPRTVSTKTADRLASRQRAAAQLKVDRRGATEEPTPQASHQHLRSRWFRHRPHRQHGRHQAPPVPPSCSSGDRRVGCAREWNATSVITIQPDTPSAGDDHHHAIRRGQHTRPRTMAPTVRSPPSTLERQTPPRRHSRRPADSCYRFFFLHDFATAHRSASGVASLRMPPRLRRPLPSECSAARSRRSAPGPSRRRSIRRVTARLRPHPGPEPGKTPTRPRAHPYRRFRSTNA